MPRKKPVNIVLVLALVLLLGGVALLTSIMSKNSALAGDDDHDHEHEAGQTAPHADH